MIYKFDYKIINNKMYIVYIKDKGYLVFRINELGNKEISFTTDSNCEDAAQLYRVTDYGKEVQSRPEIGITERIESYLLNGNFMLNYKKQWELLFDILRAISDGDEYWYNPINYEFEDYDSRNTAIALIKDDNEIWVEETEDNLRYVYDGNEYTVINPIDSELIIRSYTDEYTLDIVSKVNDWNNIGKTYVIDYMNQYKTIIQLEGQKRVEISRDFNDKSFTFISEKKFEMERIRITYEDIKEKYNDYCEVINYIEIIKEGNIIYLYEIDDFVEMLTRLINNIAENKVYPSKMSTIYGTDDDKYRMVEMLQGNYMIVTSDTTNQFIFVQRLYRNDLSPIIYWDTILYPDSIEKVVVATRDSIDLISERIQ